MAANVETMFSVREKPWHGLGTIVAQAVSSKEALQLAGLDWKVEQTEVYTAGGTRAEGYKANVRSSDGAVLGIVSDRYRIVQNEEAFAFTDALLGEGVRYETAGALQGGKKTWILAHLPHEYIITGERISPYLVFANSHDGSAAMKVAVTPVRVVCQNTLNLALQKAKRSWSAVHSGSITAKLDEAHKTLFMAEKYMDALGKEIEELQRVKMTDARVLDFIEELLPCGLEVSTVQKRNVEKLREDMKARYFDAPDLQEVERNAYRFINAVSDFATHAKPLRQTDRYKENLFLRTLDGNPMIDKAYQMICAA
ncbi:MAG: DUF932 domain-containing protein [Eubacteriales bacterium]|nr:DUF932 domain-containing protein [Eubacteriales bacterium]